MSEPTPIQDGFVVQMNYTLTNPEGEVIDSSEGAEPLAYLHGGQNIVPGLERQLTGHTVGDKVSAVVLPAEGYGERQGPGPQPVPRDQFPPDVEIEAGMVFQVEGPDGQPFPIWVSAVDGDAIMIDMNHPLAGVTLHFDVEITGVREATVEELSHGHPHGPGGAHDH